MRDKPAKPDVEELTFFEGNSNRLTVRKNTNGGMWSLTSCQVNRRTVRMDTTGSGMKSLTNWQANKISTAVRNTAGLTGNHLHPFKLTGPKWQWGQWEEHSWTWHEEITHKLSSPQDHSDSQDNEKVIAELGMESLTVCQTNRQWEAQRINASVVK